MSPAYNVQPSPLSSNCVLSTGTGSRCFSFFRRFDSIQPWTEHDRSFLSDFCFRNSLWPKQAFVLGWGSLRPINIISLILSRVSRKRGRKREIPKKNPLTTRKQSGELTGDLEPYRLAPLTTRPRKALKQVFSFKPARRYGQIRLFTSPGVSTENTYAGQCQISTKSVTVAARTHHVAATFSVKKDWNYPHFSLK